MLRREFNGRWIGCCLGLGGAAAAIGMLLALPAIGTAAPIRIPVRWCVLAEMDAPFSQDDPGGGPSFEDPSVMLDADGIPETSVKGVLWRRGERITDNIYLSQADITFRSGATFEQPSFPVIDDTVRVGDDKPGDMIVSCAPDGSGGGLCSGLPGDDGAEFAGAIDRCLDAWIAEDPASEGLIAVQINEWVDANGERTLIGGFGYSGGSLGSRTAVADVAYFAPGTGFTWQEIPDILGVAGDWQEKLFGHEVGHTLTLGHIAPLNGPTSDNLMQYELPTDPDPAVSMFGTLLTASQISDAASFACSSIGGVQNCPDNPPALRIGSGRDDRGDVAFALVDITGFGVAEDPFEQELRLMVDLAEAVALQTVIVSVFVDADNDPSTGGDPTSVVPSYEGPGGIEVAAIAGLSQLNVNVFRFDGASLAAVADPGIEASLTPLVGQADDFFGGTGAVIDMGAALAIRIPEGLVDPFGGIVAVGVQAHLSFPEGGEVVDHALGELVLDAPAYPSCELTPAAAAPGEQVQINVQGMPSDRPVIVYLGDQRVAEGATGLTGSESLQFAVPGDARAGTRLVTVGVDDAVNAITADCELEVEGEGGGPGDGTPIPPFCKLLLILCLILLVTCFALVIKLWKLCKGRHKKPAGY